MIPIDVLLTFFCAALLLAIAPGPDNLFVLTQSVAKGPRAGIAITLGLCTGLLFHTTAVAFGVAAIFQASNLAFTLLKLVGATYLLYLAWQSYRSASSDLHFDPSEKPFLLPLYRRGIVMNVTNPKVSIFFLAFLPQFADPSRGPMASQMLLLGFCFIVAALLTFLSISIMSGAIAHKLRTNASAQRIMNKAASFVFAGLAVRLAFARR